MVRAVTPKLMQVEVVVVDEQSEKQASINEMWRAAFMGELHHFHRLFSMIPASPRCKVCFAPFRGPGGAVMRLVGRSPSRMNPRMCGMCEHFARDHPGGAEIPLTMLFADIRGSTALAETLGTKRFSALIARFYDAVTGVLVDAIALIDRLIGDEVVALFIPGFAGPQHAKAAVQAAQRILRVTGHGDPGGPWVPVGIGVHTGSAFVGAVGTGGVSDITALGDDVNLTARLASLASLGQIILTETAREAAGVSVEGLTPQRFELKGRSAPAEAWIMSAETHTGQGAAK